MTDPVPEPGDATKPSAASTQDAVAPTSPAPKKPGVLRKAAFIILGVVILAFAVVLPWWIDRMVLNGIKSGLANRGLELDAKSDLSFSLIRTRLSGANLIVREQGKPDAAPVFTADRLEAKLALLDSISSGDAIIDELALEGAAGDLRRRKDGTSPVDTTEGSGSGGGTDWVGMAKKGMEYLKKQQEEQKKKEDGKTEPVPPKEKKAKPAYDWTGANRYEPSPVPGKPMHIPRVLVRKLSVTGKALALPDKTPFDVAGFSLKGTNVANKLVGEEVMDLNGDATTVGAGPLTLKLKRAATGNGALDLSAASVPLAAIADRNVSGDALAHYGPTGTAAVTVSTEWLPDWTFVGLVNSSIQKLTLNPDRESGDRARQVAQVVNNLKDQTVVWPVKLGGTLFAPTITDNGVETVIKTAGTDAVKNAALQKGEEELNKAVGDKLKDQPAAQDAVNKAKDLLKGWGK